MTHLAAVILAYNESKNIRACIDSVSWADRVVVVDTMSTDDTVELAHQAGAEVIRHPFEHYAQIRNVALDQVDSSWIFFVDADERSTSELEIEIRAITDKKSPRAVGWWVPRHNYIFGKLTMSAGWYPDYQMRLLKRGHAHYERPVHEIVVLDGPEGHLEHPLLHYNYQTLGQFRDKQNRYTDLDASILFREGVRPHRYTPYTQAIRQFRWRFVELGGYRDGFHGLRLCSLMAYYEAMKYRKLLRLIN